MSNKPSTFVLTLLSVFAPSLEALEVTEIEKLLEQQFKSDPALAEGMIKSGEAFFKSLDAVAQKSSSTVLKSLVDGFKQALDAEAALHNIAI